ncbi:putative Sodium:solute symporter family protein [Alphaproteobacteria bacterium]
MVVDIAIILAYLAGCVIVALYKARKIKNIKEYALGAEYFPISILVGTTFAAAVGSVTTIGTVEKVYSLGLAFALPTLLEPLRWFIMGKLMAPHIKRFHENHCLTMGDIMHLMYGPLARWLLFLGSIFISITVITTSNMALGFTLEYFLGIPQSEGFLWGTAFIAIYSITGGIRAVALTDVFQLVIFFIAFPLACAMGYHAMGGMHSILAALPKSHTTIDSSNIGSVLSLVFYTLIPYTGIAYVQRGLMAKNEEYLRSTFYIVGLISFPFTLVICLMGLVAYITEPNLSSPNLALFFFIDHYLPTGMIGLMVAAILAVIMSTVSAFLNSGSVILVKDVFKNFWPSMSDKQQLVLVRLSGLILVILSTFVAFGSKTIIEVSWLLDNFWDPLISIPLLAGFLRVKVTKEQFTAVVCLTTISVLTARFMTGEFSTIGVAIGCMVSGVSLYVAHRLNKSITTGIDSDTGILNENLITENAAGST